MWLVRLRLLWWRWRYGVRGKAKGGTFLDPNFHVIWDIQGATGGVSGDFGMVMKEMDVQGGLLKAIREYERRGVES